MALASPRSGATITMLACGAPLFVAWKHAMVLGDASHARAFMLFGFLVLCLILVPLLCSKRRWTAALLFVPSVLLFAPWFHYRARQTGGIASLGQRLAEPLLLPGRLGGMGLHPSAAHDLLVKCHRGCCVCHRFRGARIEPDHTTQAADAAAGPQ